jgi:hypothetical protein
MGITKEEIKKLVQDKFKIVQRVRLKGNIRCPSAYLNIDKPNRLLLDDSGQ